MAKETTYTHPSVTAIELVEDIIHSVDTMPKMGLPSVPLMIWGQPGVGKSQIARQVGEELGRPVIDIRLLLKDPTDLSGIPYFNPVTQRMDYAAPNELPPSQDEIDAYISALAGKQETVDMVEPNAFERVSIIQKVQKGATADDLTETERGHLMFIVDEGNAIVFLDELPSATPAVQAAALQLVLERRIGTYKLPKNASILAAGNRAEDATVHFSMPTPLRNRFSHRTLEVDHEAWNEWALNSGIHPLVVGFLKNSTTDLNKFDPKNKAEYAFATPRSWEFVSNYLWSMTNRKDMRLDKTQFARIRRNVEGLIGVGTSAKFMATAEVMSRLPSVDDVLNGTVTEFDLENEKQSLSFMMIVNLCYHMRATQAKLKETEDPTAFRAKMETFGDNYFRFLIKNLDFQQDMIIMGASLALSRYALQIDDCEGLGELLDKYENIMDMI